MSSLLNKEQLLYKCPLCNLIFKSKGSVTRHLNSSNEFQHVKYRNHIALLQNTYKNCENEDFKYIGCNEKKCVNCDEYKNCIRKEKSVYEDAKKSYNQFLKSKLVHSNEYKPSKTYPNSAKSLLHDFYNLANVTSSINYQADITKLYMMFRKNIAPEHLRSALQLLAQRGDQDLRHLSVYLIQEAVKCDRYLHQLQDPTSLPSLVKQFHDMTHQPLANSLLVKYVDRFNLLINEYNLTNEQCQYVINYMIKKNITTFNFINHQIPLALKEFKDNKTTEITEDDYIEYALQQLKDGQSTFARIQQMYSRDFNNYIFDILQKRKYNSKFSAIEWLYIIQYPIDSKTYFIAKDQIQYSDKLYHFSNDNDAQHFISWLRNCKTRYEY